MKIKKYWAKEITFPCINFEFKRPNSPKDKTVKRFRIELKIVADKKLEILFGVMLLAGSKYDEQKNSFEETAYIGMVESKAIFEVDEKIPQIKKVTELMIVANMLAAVFPFLREKMSYLLGANHVVSYLESFNIVEFLQQNVDAVKVEDLRG